MKAEDNKPVDPQIEDKVEEKELQAEEVFQFFDTNEEAYLQYLSQKTGREIKSPEDLIEVKEVVKEKEIELPEDVKSFWEYKKNTGRGFDDFLSAKRDWSKESKELVVMEHIRQTEGLEGDLLRDYYELNFVPDEDEVSEKDVRMAKIRFEQRYHKALKHFKENQKQFTLPTDTKTHQREAEEFQRAETERFKQGMDSALNNLASISIKDFTYEVQKTPEMSKFTSIDGILSKYRKGDTFDYEGLLKVLYAGENVERIAHAYAEQLKTEYIDNELKQVSKPPEVTPKEGETPIDMNKMTAEIKKFMNM